MTIRIAVGLVLVVALGLVGCANSADDSTPLANRTWISPAKVYVANFHAGARAEWNLTLHNGKDGPATFCVSYRLPDHCESDYSEAPATAQNWIIIADPTPTLAPRETRDILIALDMPENTIVLTDRWEFWISVIDTTQHGNIVTELCSRWLITFRR